MKLLRLKLNSSFRSLPEGFEVNFLREWNYDQFDEFHPYAFVGRNGSGKSNVLEALAAIFYHIECIYLEYRPEDFELDVSRLDNVGQFTAEHCEPDAFELEYLINDDLTKKRGPVGYYKGQLLAHVRIVKEAGKRPIISHSPGSPTSTQNGEKLTRDEVKAYLPEYILGYSSGHNEVLSLPFFKMRFIHFDEYFDKLTKQLDYRGRPEGRMIYLDKQFTQAILLCHFIFPSVPILKVFRDKVQLQDIRKVRIIINRSMIMRAKHSRDNGSKLLSELTRLQEGFINKLRACSTCSFEEEVGSIDEGPTGHILYLDFCINEATKYAFKAHFGMSVSDNEDENQAESALNLFQSFQTLLTLNYYSVDEATKFELYGSDSLYVDETIPIPASHERIIRFKEGELTKENVDTPLYIKSLSDGEYQLLHTIGLALLFRHKNALFLLDEPETHLNPDWRASYISTLRQALETNTSSKVLRDVLLTSHSPFIVSDCDKENVLIFKKDPDTKKVCYERPDFQTFGASANTITLKVFEQTETIGDHALEVLDQLKERLANKESPEELIAEANKILGDSVEKVLFIKQALDQETEG